MGVPVGLAAASQQECRCPGPTLIEEGYPLASGTQPWDPGPNHSVGTPCVAAGSDWGPGLLREPEPASGSLLLPRAGVSFLPPPICAPCPQRDLATVDWAGASLLPGPPILSSSPRPRTSPHTGALSRGSPHACCAHGLPVMPGSVAGSAHPLWAPPPCPERLLEPLLCSRGKSSSPTTSWVALGTFLQTSLFSSEKWG